MQHLKAAYYSFKKCTYSGGYGGAAWFTCTDKIVDIYNFAISGNVDKAISNFNDVIHLNHNGGFYLNKVIDKSYFDEAAKNPSEFTIKHLHRILNILKTIHDFINKKLPYDNIEFIDKNKILSFSSVKNLYAFLQGKEIVETTVKTETATKKEAPITASVFSSKDELIKSAFNEAKELLYYYKDTNLYIKPKNNKEWTNKAIVIKNSLKASPVKSEQVGTLTSIPYYWAIDDVKGYSKEFINKYLVSANIVMVHSFTEEEFVLNSYTVKSSDEPVKSIAKETEANLEELFGVINNLYNEWKTMQSTQSPPL